MQVHFDFTAAGSDCSPVDLRVMCGPRYNAFAPGVDRREEPGKFFRHAVTKAVFRRRSLDDDTERWDGLE